MKYALIDIGSNSVRMVLYRMTAADTFEPMLSQKYMAGLAAYVKNGEMTKDGTEKLCHILLECQHLLSELEVNRTCLFATAALRNVSNTQSVLDCIFQRTGYLIKVISGSEEAFLDYFGVMYGKSMEQGVLVDIGGGSTEITTFAADGPAYMESMQIGSLQLHTEMVSKIFPKEAEVEQIQKRIRQEMKKIKLDKVPPYDTLCAVGGTARTVLKLLRAQKQVQESPFFTAEQFQILEKRLFQRDEKAKDLILQVCPERVHTILPGILILDAVLKQLHCNQIYVSPYGVREGYLLRHCCEQQK